MDTSLLRHPATIASAIAVAGFACVSLAFALTDADADDIEVDVHEAGPVIVIDVAMHARVPQAVAWNVLTDFDNMARIVSTVESSRIVEARPDRVVVFQKGAYREGLLSFDYETLREVELRPNTAMRSRLIRGSLERLDGETRLSRGRGGGTDIVSHGECIPGGWVPHFMGIPFVRKATRVQYAEMRREMTRRAEAK